MRDFGVVVPGRPLLSSEMFGVNVNGLVCTPLPNPRDVNSLTLFLEKPLPTDACARESAVD